MSTQTKARIGRPPTPRDVADRQTLIRIANLAAFILVCLRAPGHGRYDSERSLKLWLQEDGISFTTEDVPMALSWLEAMGMVVRPGVKQNASRPGWLPPAAPELVWSSSEAAVEDITGVEVEPAPVDVAEPVEDVSTSPAEDAVDALARAIVRTFDAPDRGYNGNRHLCESEDRLRGYLTDDGATFDDQLLAAALTKLETATVRGSNMRLIRGEELRRRNGSRHLPAARWPERAMMLESVHPFDSMEYERAEIVPYLT